MRDILSKLAALRKSRYYEELFGAFIFILILRKHHFHQHYPFIFHQKFYLTWALI